MAKSDKEKHSLDELLKVYLDSIRRGERKETSEMEVRFGTARGMKAITRIEYDNVIRRLVSAGFVVSTTQYLLRINSEYMDPDTGTTSYSNVRTELTGIGAISEYCKTNSLDDLYAKGLVKFNQKSNKKTESGDTVESYDAIDFNFRASLSVETDITQTAIARSMVASWKDSRKEFRYINRHTLTHIDFPINVDISIVKQSFRKGQDIEKSYTFSEANLSRSPEKYEIELEINNDMVGLGSPYETPEILSIPLRKAIMFVLSGLQGTNYPVSYSHQNDILQEYMHLLLGDKYTVQKIYSKNFVGPSSVALQVNNIALVNEDTNIPNIRGGYTVTEKADGERKLLMIAKDGRIYLIDTNMNVQFTGAKTNDKKLFDSIVDGEHILHDKEGRHINLYAAFDIYYMNGTDVRTLGFMGSSDDKLDEFRLPLLNSLMSQLKAFGINSRESLSPMRFEVKIFYNSTSTQTIFKACSYLMTKIDEGVFEYKTDGLIFTPMLTGVGSSKIGVTTPPRKKTWDLSFKWKPPVHNTIDFMVTMQRGTDGREVVKNVFQSGIDLGSALQITQYKIATLRVGFDESIHGYINPCLNVIEDDLPVAGDKDNEENYRPLQFFPTKPADDEAGVCNLLMESTQGGNTAVFTENREVIEDNTIVEFRYNLTKEKGWRWEPLRVRYDKTAELRSGGKNYGNAYHVANSNWHSIHKPITKEMITSGLGIPEESAEDDVYYSKASKSSVLKSLRDFHNLYVKKKLIMGTTSRGDTLIDFAVGMGGDFTKWIAAKLRFVFGIDISRDSIENRMQGACARYLTNRKQYKIMPSALFVVGNSSVNIRDTNAILTDKGKQITNAIFGKGAKDAVALGKGVYKHYGIAETGFNVSSIQFAMHYMFGTVITLANFLRNVSETTKVGGYFIGTCYDGGKVFSILNDKKQGEGIELNEDSSKMWEIIRRYESSVFPPSAVSLGYSIDVFTESIGKVAREYLVNFEYLEQLLPNFGLAQLTPIEAKAIGLPAGRGSFRELYAAMEDEIKKNSSAKNNYGTAQDMTPNEKTMSFLNNYFVYKKTHDVDANSVAASMISGTRVEKADELFEPAEELSKAEPLPSSKPKKIARKLKLV